MGFIDWLPTSGISKPMMEACSDMFKCLFESDASTVRQTLTDMAIAKHDNADCLWDTYPYADTDEIDKISDEQFEQVVGPDVHRDNLTEEELNELSDKWLAYLRDENLLTWYYTWNS